MYVELTPHEQELYDWWVLFVDSKSNTEAGGATTQDDSDAASFVDSSASDDCIGSDTSESTESNASHISSGDSAIVEEREVAPTLAKALKSNNPKAVTMMQRRYAKQLARFRKDIERDRFHRWLKLQMKKQAYNNMTPEEKAARKKEIKPRSKGGDAAKVEKERKEDEAREQEAAAEQLRSGGKEKIYSTEGAKEKIYTREEQMGVWGGAEAKELKTQNNQDAKEEDKMSLPMNSQLQEHGQHGQRDGCSSTEKKKEQESRAKMPCIY